MPQGRNLAINLVVRSKQASKQLNQFETRTQRLGRALKVGLAVGATAAGAAITRFAGQSITAASDASEAMNKVNEVFGDAASTVKKFADSSVTDLALSEGAALEAAGTFGNLFTSFGSGQREAANMSTELVQLAADLASFENVSVDEALRALRSGISGEMEALKRFGITLSDVRLRAEAAAMGLEVTTGALDPLTKSLASYSLIMKDSTNAQGDLARTSDGLANTQKILGAAVQDAKEEIGQGLLGAIENTTAAFGGAEGLAGVIEQNAYEIGLLIKGLAELVPESDKAAESADNQKRSIQRLGKLYNTAGGGLTGYGAALSVLLLKNPKAVFTTNTLADAFKIVGAASDQSKAATAAWDRVQNHSVKGADHLTRSIDAQRRAVQRVSGAWTAAAARAAAYNAVSDKDAYFDLAAELNRLAKEARDADTGVRNYGGSVSTADTKMSKAEIAAEGLKDRLAEINGQLSNAATEVDSAISAFDSFSDRVNSSLGSGINLSGLLPTAEVREAAEKDGRDAGQEWVLGFFSQLTDAENAGPALDRLRAELQNESGELIAGAELLFNQVLSAPAGAIPAVVDDLINSGLIPNLAGKINNVFNGPVGDAWALTFRGEGLNAATNMLDGLETEANKLKPDLKKVGKNIGKDIREGIQAEIDGVLAQLADLEGRVSGARARGVKAVQGGGRDYTARNRAAVRAAPVSEARAIAELLRNAERTTGAAS